MDIMSVYRGYRMSLVGVRELFLCMFSVVMVSNVFRNVAKHPKALLILSPNINLALFISIYLSFYSFYFSSFDFVIWLFKSINNIAYELETLCIVYKVRNYCKQANWKENEKKETRKKISTNILWCIKALNHKKYDAPNEYDLNWGWKLYRVWVGRGG